MKIFLYISAVTVSLSILYPPWGTQLLSVAVLNLCLHLMDLKTGANVKRRQTKKPLDIRPRAPETQTPQTQDVINGLLNMGLKKSEAVRLVLQVRQDQPSLRDTSEILKRCITLSYKK
jgi:Holliday junction resolvasome RuvABC DNA-binding subunit